MKNKFFNLLLLVAIAVGGASCDSPENSMSHIGTFTNVFDVKEGLLCPTFSDNKYSVNNLTDIGLRNGDRAYLRVDYVYDVYGMASPYMNISEFYTKVPFLSMSKKGTFDKERYTSSLSSVHPIDFSEINDAWGVDVLKESFLWADDETQNVAVRYDDDYIGSFKMTLDSVHNGAIYDSTGRMAKVLCFRLYTNLSPANGTVDGNTFQTYESDKVSKILSYKMDWDMLKEELERSNELSEITDCEILTSRISFTSDLKENNDVVTKIAHYFTYDYFKNPLYIGK